MPTKTAKKSALDGNKVKEATVVFVDGRRVGVNVTGDVIQEATAPGQPPNPNAGKLVPELTIDLRNCQTLTAYDAESGRGSAKPIRPAQISPGDKISCGWAGNPAGAAMPNSATVVRSRPDDSKPNVLTIGTARSFTAADAITGAQDTPKTSDGVPVGENYPNTKQVVGDYVRQGELSAGTKVRTDADELTASPNPGPGTDDERSDDDEDPTVGAAADNDDDDETEDKADLDSLTVPELKEKLDSAGVAYDSSDKKADLVRKARRAGL